MQKTPPPKLSRHEDFLAEMLKDPKFRAGYEALEAEFSIISALIAYRARHELTQKELAERVGMKQSALARFESGRGNPTMKFLQRIADGLGMELVVTLRPRV